MRTFLTTLALVAAIAFAGSSLAYACDDCPCEKGAANADAKVTATKSPVHSMMKWVASQVAPKAECGCPSSAEGEKAWRAWYAAEGGALADLRTAMKKDGWTADRTIGFFKAMAASKSCGSCDKSKAAKTTGVAAPTGDAGTTGDAKGSCCGGCDKAKGKGCCGGCNKAKASGAAAPTGDAGATGDAKSDCCGGCDKAKGCCGGCNKNKASGAAAPTGDAGATGDAKSDCCGGCDKAKGCCGGCNKNKAAGAAAPTGDAGATGDAKAGNCCGGCDKAKAKTMTTATKTPIHSMMKWVGSHVAPELDCACPATEKGEMAWRAWYAAKDAPLADLRAAMIKDGWTAKRTITFFKNMAAQKDCGSCDKGKDCGGCDKAKGAAAPTGDAGTTGDSAKCPCTGKPMKDCGGCDKAKCPCGKKDKAATPNG